ncbi:transcription factor A, mitochondrial [Clarias gariepinus]|uniref:transcription factor A, mitochondrial n=1 Tax=Clarias gariepinus TaxID=13013 RepID=UPI00234D1655|nr:transcription factor A, mitochondrial [Clarias gariepinus]
MAPFNFVTVGANLLARSLGLFSSAVTVRCSCVAPALKHFSTTAGPPKRPLTAYMRYVKEQQPIVVRQNPEVKIVDIVRKIAQQWRTLTPEEKRPFEEASMAAREQYKVDKKAYQDQLTPAQSAAIAEEKRQKMAKRKAIRKKRELNSLGKPKRPRSAFNIFMAEHFEEAKGSSMTGKMKSLFDDWKSLSLSQKQIYMQLAEDDKVRYKNEIKTWEEHMVELGREDLVRRRESRRKKAATKSGKKKSKVKVLKATAPAKKTAEKKTATAKTKTPNE